MLFNLRNNIFFDNNKILYSLFYIIINYQMLIILSKNELIKNILIKIY